MNNETIITRQIFNEEDLEGDVSEYILTIKDKKLDYLIINEIMQESSSINIEYTLSISETIENGDKIINFYIKDDENQPVIYNLSTGKQIEFNEEDKIEFDARYLKSPFFGKINQLKEFLKENITFEFILK